MNWFVLFAFLSPLFYALMNVIDKYIVVHKVRNTLSYAPVVGLATIIYAGTLAFFLDWNQINFSGIMFPLITGALLTIQTYLYLFMLRKQDASSLIGFLYTYPIIVALLSFAFLHEQLSFVGYLGIVLVVLGAVLLSARVRKLKLKVVIWMMLSMIILTGFYEFLIKATTNNMPALNGLAINLMSFGMLCFAGLIFRPVRKGFKREMKNLKWAFLSEAATFAAVMFVFLSMAGLKATIVSTISAIQPLILLFMEQFAQRKFGKFTKDLMILPRLIAIAFIVIGVAVLCLVELA